MADEQLGWDIPGGDGRKPEASEKRGKSGGAGAKAEGGAAATEGDTGPRKLDDNEIFDYITGTKVVKLTDAEKVRQQVARALVRQYAIDPKDMEPDFPVPVENENGRKVRRRVSIAIFEHGKDHVLENIHRIVITRARPKDSRTVSKIRTFAHAKAEIDEVADLMHAAGRQCQFGMWTDDKDLYFIRRDPDRWEDNYLPMLNWPRGDATEFDARGHVSSLSLLRRADETMLRFAFRRCHDYIHGNQGLPKDAAFWQFLYVLFAKLYDERLVDEGQDSRFRIDSDDLAAVTTTEAGSPEVGRRIRALFEEVKQEYGEVGLFDEYDRLTLDDAALSFLTKELATYQLHGTSLDALGTAYQELVGDNLRGDRGQYFTPNVATRFMVEVLDPQLDETVLDPCCGTGGFLREVLLHVMHREWMPDDERSLSMQERARLETGLRDELGKYATDRVFGLDFDPFLVRAASFGVLMLTEVKGNTFQVDSLGFPRMGNLPGFGRAMRHLDRIGLGKVHVLVTNPPFGTDIPVTGPVLELFRTEESGAEKQQSIAYGWSRKADGSLKRGKPAVSMSPERLFVQKCVEWVKPGGRIGIVLPNGILSNPGPDDEAVRRYILDECWVLASVELPVEPFVFGAGVNILTTMLFLRKKTEREKSEERLYGAADYPVFMSVVEKVGHDRRGNTLWVRDARGDFVIDEYWDKDEVLVRDTAVERQIKRRDKIRDNDLMSLRNRPLRHNRPNVIDEYRDFVKRYNDEFPWKKGNGA